MNSFARRTAVVTTVILALGSTVLPHPFPTSQKKEAMGSISGRVTTDDRPARGVTVLIVSAENVSGERVTSRAKTDQEGHFQVKGVPAGSYFVQAFAPGLIGENDYQFGGQGKPINLSEGEAAAGVEITLRSGGVITGRVTDADGQPLIQESVRLFLVSEQTKPRPIYLPYNFMFSTDDRGVYRLFGVPAGRYIVGVGVDTGGPNTNFGNSSYPLTYYPDASEEAKATILEVASGNELSGVDIVLGRKSQGYSVSGRIVDAVSGKPLIGMMYGFGTRDEQSGRLASTSYTNSTSNARGEFRLENVTPGQYAAFASPAPDSDMYSDLGTFTVKDGDITGVIVKVHIGSRIIGNVIIEGADGQPGAPRVSEIRLGVHSSSLNVAPRGGQVRIDPDGSFRTIGLPRGMATFSTVYPSPKGLALVRVERDGVEQNNGIEIGADEEISGVKVVFGYGTGSIRGQVKVEGGDITASTLMYLNIRRVGANQPLNLRMPPVDLRGRFVIDGLQAGEYELSLMFQTRLAAPAAGGRTVIAKDVKQTVTVTNGSETQVTMTVDLNTNDR
jgi:hypothetical protein